VKPYLKHLAGFRDRPEYYFYRVLVLCEVYGRHSPKKQEIFVEEMRVFSKEIAKLAHNAAPCNFLHKHLILDAEIGKVLGHFASHEILQKYMNAAK
jgi:hypothetical protein